MKPLLVLFTLISGNPIYIAPTWVAAVTPPTNCAAGANAKVYTVAAPFCVKETVEEAKEKLK